jgi:hypothetical protein
VLASEMKKINFVVTGIDGIEARLNLDEPIDENEEIEWIWKSQGNEVASAESNALYDSICIMLILQLQPFSRRGA